MAQDVFLNLQRRWPPTVSYLLWATAWLAAVLGLTIWSFRRREI